MSPDRQIAGILAGALLLTGCNARDSFAASVRTDLEDRTATGEPFTSSTQSFLRGEHWLEEVRSVEVKALSGLTASLELRAEDREHFVRFENLDLRQLVPRLHYAVAEEGPDAFDAFNLMMAEYSRNGVSVPHGVDGDTMAHFESDLEEAVPWKLASDYEFIPNPFVRPVRIAVVNNCLRPGLWELSASDRSGEIYHGWFDFPEDLYYRFVSEVNDVPTDFVRSALAWRVERVPLELARLRESGEEFAPVNATTIEPGAAGYSSQDSRRKLGKGFATVVVNGEHAPVTNLAQLTEGSCYLTSFVEPGKYSIDERREFDLGFLRETRSARVRRVWPRASYRGAAGEADDPLHYVELELELESFVLMLGNLPLEWIVPHEDFAIHGFGVGVLSSSGLAERRRYLIEQGPAPSYAYLCVREDGRLVAVNSHDYGLEQIFLRTHLGEDDAWWELTLTSYERISDLIKYRVEIPQALLGEVRRHAGEYVAPLCFTYRDDNLR